MANLPSTSFLDVDAFLLSTCSMDTLPLEQPKTSHKSVTTIKEAPGCLRVCPICIDDFRFRRLAKRLLCGHVLHVSCFNQQIQYKLECPLCREMIY